MNNEYKLIESYSNISGGKGIVVYEIINYDGNKEKLRKFVDKKNDESDFWKSWRIINDEKGIIEEEIDPLD